MVNILDLGFQGKKETIASFLLETTEGPILIETGPYSTINKLKKGLKKHGYAMSDVKHVFITHVHFDHAGAAWAFAQNGATIYVHPEGKKHLKNPEKLYNSAKRIYGDKMEELWGAMEAIPDKQLVAVADGKKVKVGKTKLKAIHTPGHAVHHISWELKDILFAGDVAGVKIGEGAVVPPCPPPDINIEAWEKSIRKILNKRYQEVYLTHFGKVENVKPHLIELRGRLRNWANWIKPYFDEGASPDKITPKFEKYVQMQIKASGATKAQIARYEGANPSWMSVSGLLRYWKKKEG